MPHPIVPEQVKGQHTDIIKAFTSATREEALDSYNRACKRLQNPPIWHKLCGALSAEFELVDETGAKAERLAQAHDYIKIDLPGPGPGAGGGFDWVVIEAIEDATAANTENDRYALQVRSSPPPKKLAKDIAHFFEGGATSTFVIQREGNTVTASYHGRNEVANVNTESMADNIRNGLVASAAFAGLSEVQWSALVAAFLHPEL